MDHIPVTFTHQGKQVSGTLAKVAGAGSMYYLSVDNFHWGQLWYVEAHPGFPGHDRHPPTPGQWRFASNPHPELSEKANEFGDVVQLWYE